jgi:hypothetical protein
MDLMEAMEKRHSVRSYRDEPITGAVREALQDCVDACSRESGLDIRLCLDEPRAFASPLASYGTFSNVKNYVVLAGRREPGLDETCGYYGEAIVLRAQQLGLNTCWVAMSYSRGRVARTLPAGERVCCVIAVGYGATQGVHHKSKALHQVCQVRGDMPDWFRRGVEAALLAPTAVNQQKFCFTLELDRNEVFVEPGFGFYTRIDLGIAKYHFEVGAGKDNFTWKLPEGRL